MELQYLNVSLRDGSGKGPARRTRAQGLVPAVIYGGEGDAISVNIDRRLFEVLVQGRYGEHALVQLEVKDRPEISSPALLKDVQHHPVNGRIVHADFMRIRLDERIQTVASVVLIGLSRGIVDGGVLDQQMRALEIECLALEVPEKIEVDITELGIGHSITVSGLTVPEGVTVLSDPDRPVVTIHAPRVAEVTEAAVEAVAAEGEKSEPEVISKAKEEKD